MTSKSKFVTLFQRLWALKNLIYIFWIYRERLCLVRSEAIPERRHNSGVGSSQNSFYCVARWEKARMAGGRSSNTANRANYHRITGKVKLESGSEKGKVKVISRPTCSNSSNTANTANYHRITGRVKLKSESKKGKWKGKVKLKDVAKNLWLYSYWPYSQVYMAI